MTSRRPATVLRDVLRPGDPVSTREAAAIAGSSPQSASAALTHLARRGDFERVRNGLWIRSGAPPDPYRLGARITKPYAFAYGSALELHGMSSVAIRSLVLVASERRFASFDHAGIRYRRADPWWPEGLTRLAVGPEFVSATTLERTVVECIRVPANAGGLDEVFRSIPSLPPLDATALVDWVDRYGEANLAARVGYLLDVAGASDASAKALEELEKRTPSSKIYLDPGQRGGTLNPRWNVIVPQRLARLAAAT